MQASICANLTGRSASNSSAPCSHEACCFRSRRNAAPVAVRSSGRLSRGVWRQLRHTRCAAELGEDRQLDTDLAANRAEGIDAYPAASAASASGGDTANVWDDKPPWCQPWTIVLTGATIDAIAWTASGHSLLVTGLVGFPVAVWWWLFLGVMPAQYAEYKEQMASEERQHWQ